jgi:hypothetical protein
MKVTKKMLRDIIKEELAKMLKETPTITNKGGKIRTVDSRFNNRARGNAGRHAKDKFARRAYSILFDRSGRPNWKPGQTSAQGLSGAQQADNRNAFVQINDEASGYALHVSEAAFSSYLQQLRGINPKLFDGFNGPVVAEVETKEAFTQGRGDQGGSYGSAQYVIGWEEAIKEVYPKNKVRVLGKIKDVVETYELPPPASIQRENKEKSQNQVILENHRLGRQAHPVTKKEWWNEEV